MFNKEYADSLVDLLLAILGSARSVRRFRTLLHESELKRYKKESVRVALSRLHKKGYVNNSAFGWSINATGKKHFANRKLLEYISSPFKKDQSANFIISFDIPERDRVHRHWLRNQIKIFGYKILQQSLWIGPGPLPEGFLNRLKDLEIKDRIKIFKLTGEK